MNPLLSLISMVQLPSEPLAYCKLTSADAYQTPSRRSDALGHVLNMIGRDWTHLGVAKLYSDIAANGYHIMYLTSRSVGQADTTRNYLNNVVQDRYRLPKGPVILSPDRTIAALRREVYLRKPEVFKMACLRDIYNLFGQNINPFYAGFGNRLTDALSYRSVNIPSTRIFTINSNAEVSLDLLSLNTYKSSYVSMRELVDHVFPPVGLRVPDGAESFTDFNFWRDEPLDISDFSASGSEDNQDDEDDSRASIRSEDEGTEADDNGEQMDSMLLSDASLEHSNYMGESMLEESMIDEGERSNLEESITGINLDDQVRPETKSINDDRKENSPAVDDADGKTNRISFGSPKKLSRIAKSLLKTSDTT